MRDKVVSMASRLFWILPFSLAFVIPQRAWAASSPFARQLSFQVLKTPPMAGTFLLSPNGRWLAFRESKGHGAVFYNLPSGQAWTDSRSGEPLAWSEDSSACVSRSSTRWCIARPDQHESHSILYAPSSSQKMDIAALAPRTRRLAIAYAGEHTLMRFWNGKTWTQGTDWGRLLKFPDWYRNEITPSDLTWSRDGNSLTIRFYGHADRADGSALHTAVFAVSGRHMKYLWSEDTGEVAWLDNRRLMFKGDDGGMGSAVDVDLIVAQSRTKRRQVWKSKVLAWALSPQRNFVVALLRNGDLMRSSTRHPQWQMLHRRVLSPKILRSDDDPLWLQLNVSPRGDMVALSRVSGGRGLWLFSTKPQTPWTLYWKSSTNTTSFIGWAPNRSLPLVQLGIGPAQLAQLQKVPVS